MRRRLDGLFLFPQSTVGNVSQLEATMLHLTMSGLRYSVFISHDGVVINQVMIV